MGLKSQDVTKNSISLHFLLCRLHSQIPCGDQVTTAGSKVYFLFYSYLKASKCPQLELLMEVNHTGLDWRADDTPIINLGSFSARRQTNPGQ